MAADQIYGAGKTRALVDQVSGSQTQLIALAPDYEKRAGRFVPADFSLPKAGFSLTCPNGVTTTKINFQLRMAAAAFNLRQRLRILTHRPHPVVGAAA